MPSVYIETLIWVVRGLLSYLEGQSETSSQTEQIVDEQENGEASTPAHPATEIASLTEAQVHPQDWTCTTCTLINTIDQSLCNACERPRRKMDPSSMIVPYGLDESELLLDICNESKERVQDKRWLIAIKDAAFPPEHVAWLKGYERCPDEPLRQTYRKGIVQQDVDYSAPTIHIGIVFLEGAGPAVAYAEMNRETRMAPNQRSPEWRVATAATLLRRFEVKDDLMIEQPDNSSRIMQANKAKEPQRKLLSRGSSRTSPRGKPAGDPMQSLTKRDIQDHVLNVDSDYIDIIHGDQADTIEFDIVSTLIEIDMQSTYNLLANFREIISSGSRSASSKDIILMLDTMINDVRRLCSRSPILFRLATRSTIANSTDTRYGVNFGSVFATTTTSGGIRIFIERSVAFYSSLDSNSGDEDTVRPKFLQMLVLLLALLNNDDLKLIGGFLEDTFKIPRDREGLELLILKVLPLASINPRVFMEDLLVACNYTKARINLKDPQQQKEQWQKLQQDFAEKGYIFPVLTKQIVQEDIFDDDLEAYMDTLDMEDEMEDIPASQSASHLASNYSRSWSAPWPEDKGIRDSTIFRYIQHCGKLKKEGNFQQETIKAINNIPHLNMTSEDKENEYVCVFANGSRFRIRSEDSDAISAMKRARYTLKEIEGNSIVDLEIEADILNEPFIEATKEHNHLVDTINDFLGGQKEKRRIFMGKSVPISFTRLEEPIEANRVWAELNSQSDQRQLCAEAFKLGDRIVFREHILRNMGDVLSRLDSNIARIEKSIPTSAPKAPDDAARKIYSSQVGKLRERLDLIKTLRNDAVQKRADLHKQANTGLPTDPISTVIYASFIETSGEKPEWQPYVSRLHSDRERLIIQSKIMKVDAVPPGDVMRLEFSSAKLVLTVQSLASSSGNEEANSPPPINAGNSVLWLGHYVVHVEPHATMKNSYVVQAYYKVVSQMRERIARGTQAMNEKMAVFPPV